MIEFNDISMIEAKGDFNKIKEIMEVSKWMIKTTAYITVDEFNYIFILHCWDDATIHIMNTDMPQSREMTNHLLQWLYDWSKSNNWKCLCISKDMLDHPEQYEFWLRIYRSGLVYNKIFEDQEQHEIKKYKKIVSLSENEDTEE